MIWLSYGLGLEVGQLILLVRTQPKTSKVQAADVSGSLEGQAAHEEAASLADHRRRRLGCGRAESSRIHLVAVRSNLLRNFSRVVAATSRRGPRHWVGSLRPIEHIRKFGAKLEFHFLVDAED